MARFLYFHIVEQFQALSCYLSERPRRITSGRAAFADGAARPPLTNQSALSALRPSVLPTLLPLTARPALQPPARRRRRLPARACRTIAWISCFSFPCAAE